MARRQKLTGMNFPVAVQQLLKLVDFWPAAAKPSHGQGCATKKTRLRWMSAGTCATRMRVAVAINKLGSFCSRDTASGCLLCFVRLESVQDSQERMETTCRLIMHYQELALCPCAGVPSARVTSAASADAKIYFRSAGAFRP